MKNQEAKRITPFNKEDIYNEQIRPLIEDITNRCTIYGIPFFFCACTKNDENGSEYANEANLCGSKGIVLKDDRITSHMNVVMGFKTVPVSENFEVIYDDDTSSFDFLKTGVPDISSED